MLDPRLGLIRGLFEKGAYLRWALDHRLPYHITSFHMCASLSLSVSLMQACTESKGWTSQYVFTKLLGHLSLIMCHLLSNLN